MDAIKGFCQIMKEHAAFRRQLLPLAQTDLIRSYRGAALGWAWAIIRPTMTIFVYWFAFSVGLRKGGSVDGYPYFLWLVAGITPWFYMQEMISGGTGCVRRYRYLVTKLKFPVSTIPTFVSFSKMFVNLIMTGIVMLIFIAFGYRPDIYWLQLPYYILCEFLFFTVLAQFTAVRAVLDQDFLNLVNAMITAVFWLSGIMWSPDNVENFWLRAILKVNPVTYVASGYRNCFTAKRWFFEDMHITLAFFGLLLIVQFFSARSYYRLRKDLPDVL